MADKLVPKKFNEFTKITDPTGATFAGYKVNQDIQIDFSDMTPLFGVSQAKGQDITLAPSLKLFTDESNQVNSRFTGIEEGLNPSPVLSIDGRASKDDGVINTDADWKNTGYVSIDWDYVNANEVAATAYLDCSGGLLAAPVAFYDENKIFISAIVKTGEGLQNYQLTKSNIPATASFVVFSTRTNTVTNAYVKGFGTPLSQDVNALKTDTVTLKTDLETLTNRVEVLESNIRDVNLEFKNTGRASKEDGTINDSTDWRNTGYVPIDWDIVNKNEIYAEAYLYMSNGVLAAPFCFYDENKIFISAIERTVADYTWDTYNLTKDNIPANAAFLVSTTWAATPYLQQAYVKILTTENGNEAESAELPSYHHAEMKRLKTEINDVKTALYFAFPFITDLHITSAEIDYLAPKYALRAAVELDKNICFDIFPLGGDYTNTSESTPESMTIEEVRGCLSDVALWTNEVVDRRIMLRGNHEINYHTDKNKYFDMSQKFLLFGAKMVYNENDLTGGYGYIDYPFYKLRLVFIDASLIEYKGSSSTEDKQILWLIEKAFDMSGKQGWMSVILGHMPLYPYYSSNGGADFGNYPNYRKLVSAFHRGNSTTLSLYGGSRTVNFTAQGAIPLVYVSGHTHGYGLNVADSNYLNAANDMDFLTITTMDSSTTRNTAHEAAKGTKNETSFDVYMVDTENKQVYIKRYGYGSDREFNFD